MADTYEKDLAQKSSLTTSDYIRVVGSDNVSYKQPLSNVMATAGIVGISGITAGTAPKDFIKSCLEGGTLPYDTTFVAEFSAGYYFWGVGHFYKSSSKTYGSAMVGRPGYMCKVNCSADVWTETAI